MIHETVPNPHYHGPAATALPPSGPTSLDGGARLRGGFDRAGLLRCRAGIAMTPTNSSVLPVSCPLRRPNWIQYVLTIVIVIVGGVFVYGQLTQKVVSLSEAQAASKKVTAEVTVAVQNQSIEQAVLKQQVESIQTEQREFRAEVNDALKDIVRKIDNGNRRRDNQ